MAGSTLCRQCDPREEPDALAGLYGSVRGASGNRRPYRDNQPNSTPRVLKTVRDLIAVRAALDGEKMLLCAIQVCQRGLSSGWGKLWRHDN